MDLKKIKGQSKAIKIIYNSLKSDQVAHAYMFFGPVGVGKTTTARIFGKMFLCQNGLGCNNCDSCHKFDTLNHPDFKIIEPEGSSFKIGQIRELKNSINYKAYLGHGKVYILDKVETMTMEAANAFLKILEEPPQDTLFILITEHVYKIMPTILSRCQQIQFLPLAVESIVEILNEKTDIDLESVAVVARICNGSVSRALEYLNNPRYLEIRVWIFTWLLKAKFTDTIDILKFAKEADSDKEYLNHYLDILEFCFRDVLIYRINKSLDFIINKDKLEVIEFLAMKFNNNQLIYIIEGIEKTRRIIKANVSPRLAIENMYFDSIQGLGG